MASKIVLEDAKMLSPLEVAASKMNGEVVYSFKKEFNMLLYTNCGTYMWSVKEGYLSNCGSIPWLGQMILRVKSYDQNNPLQNAAFFLHDDLYQKKGYGVFCRDDSDAICRGALREAGCSRYQASTIDFFLMLGACGHWGDNGYGNLDVMSSLEKISSSYSNLE